MVSEHIRKMTGWHWIGLYGAILVAWTVLYAMSLSVGDLRELRVIYGAEFWATLCVVSPDGAGFFRLFLMWSLMSVAMMAPTALPAFATYDDLGAVAQTNLWKLIVGYLAVWIGFSLVASGLQMTLFVYGAVDQLGQSTSRYLSAALLAIAGGYQFSHVKEACLSKCRAPLTFFMQYFDEGAWRNGLRLGLVCLGCCWALMCLAFVGGVMNLVFMGLATVLMVVEKLPQIGTYITKPLGYALLCGAALIALGLI